ncbi:MAG: PadR family transcriptional regulator [Acidimicrobiaceae bacterium]|jgi:DNA-binding PadR family transcriptional regulator|nr:PadR family transcriptional regulator [Acidimicrobiaceae bacterium]
MHHHHDDPRDFGDDGAGERRSERPHRGPAMDEGRAAFGPFGGAFGGPFGGGMGPRGRGRGRGPGGRARRGDVRAAVLALLAERPMHGYEIIQELAERTGGLWKPSPGSVYPTLQLLEDEGHVVAEEDAGKRRFSLTESGREIATALSEHKAPWEEVNEGIGPDAMHLRQATGQLMAAVFQIGHVGTPEQQAEAQAILAETRRRLYAILAAET